MDSATSLMRSLHRAAEPAVLQPLIARAAVNPDERNRIVARASGLLAARLGLWGAYMPFGSAVGLLCGPLVMAWVGWQGWWWLMKVGKWKCQ